MPKEVSIPSLLQRAALSKTPSARRNRKYAVVCLHEFLCRESIPYDMLNADLVEDYITWLITSGKSTFTVELYRKQLRSVLLEEFPEGEEQIRAAFGRTKATWNGRKDGLPLDAMRGLACQEYTLMQWTRARDLYIFSVYCAGLPFDVARQLTTDNISDGYIHMPYGPDILYTDNMRALVDQYALPGNPHLFPFITRWREEHYRDILKQIANYHNSPEISQRDSANRSWVSIGNRLGIPLHVMAACVPKRLGLLMNFTRPATTNQAEMDAAIQRICNAVADLSEHWYALRLRARRTPEDLFARLLEHREDYPHLQGLTTYYPCEDIMRLIGKKKLVNATRAYITRVLFFRTRPQYVRQLAYLLGDLGWVYRQSNSASSAYAVIPQYEMANFQRAINLFTPDINISLVPPSTLSVGRRVRLVRGPFAGCIGTIIDDATPSASPLRTFLIRFTTENALKIQLKLQENDLEALKEGEEE